MVRYLRTALLALVLLLSVPLVAYGVEPPTDDSENLLKRGPTMSQGEMLEYQQATENCDTPSLECLVYYTSRYMAIEWLQEIVGPSGNATGTGEGGLGGDASETIPGQKKITSRPGAIGGVNHMIGQMYAHRAASTEMFVADVINSSKLAQPAYAQGLGFASLNPILNLWKVFRNVAYMFFVIIFVVIGFMIMFRSKISGNAAVTAQQAIPSIIVSLIFVTFSYAIAGLMIDMMYVTLYLILGLFGSALPTADAGQIIDYNIIGLVGVMFTGLSNGGQGAWGTMWGIQGQGANIIEVFLQGLTDVPAVSGVLSWVGGVLFALIIAVAILIGTIRLFFELLKSYSTIVVSVVTAPVYLMLGAIPGRNMFTPWIKNIIGNLAAFPTVLLIVVIFFQFTGETVSKGLDAGGFMPPFLLGRGVPGGISALIGLALILALPEIVVKVKEAFGAKGGIGEFIAGAAWKSAQDGWKGKYGIPGAKLPAQLPTIVTGRFGLGKESQLENMFWGSRAARRREDEIRRIHGDDAADTPGLWGYLKFGRNRRRARVNSGNQAQLTSQTTGTSAASAAAASPSAAPAAPAATGAPPAGSPNNTLINP